MSFVKIVTYASAGLLAFCIAAPPQARADEWNQKTIFTFSGPVEIPAGSFRPGHMFSSSPTPCPIGISSRYSIRGKITSTVYSSRFRTII